jgi:hypothetical protein
MRACEMCRHQVGRLRVQAGPLVALLVAKRHDAMAASPPTTAWPCAKPPSKQGPMHEHGEDSAAWVLALAEYMILRQGWLSRRPTLRRPTPSQLVRSSGSVAGSCHPVVYHDDFALDPLPDGHRFPLPKDHLLFCTLRERGWAAKTFRPVPPDVDTLSLVRLSRALPTQAAD